MRLVIQTGLAPGAGAWRRGFAGTWLAAMLIGLASVSIPEVAARAQEGARGDPERGAKLFGRLGCNGCHTVGGIGGQVGPDLTGVFQLDLSEDRSGQTQRSIEDYARQSIEDPQAYIVPGFPEPSPMPSAETFGLSQQDIDDLIAYLERAGSADAN